jgi:hypothetical protein
MENILDHPVIRNMERTGYPDGNTPDVMLFCQSCGDEIFRGEEYYDIDGDPWCRKCISIAKTEA